MKTAQFMQARKLIDEEWMKLPKEEILQLYKNCYSILEGFINASQSQAVTPSDEEIRKEAEWRFTNGHGACDYYEVAQFMDAAKWLKSQLKQGYPQEFWIWTHIYCTFNQLLNIWIHNKIKYSLPDLYTYWQNEINK